MLKKLVKYGNSQALVLDRAILELLNMSEGSEVKLHTDGKSLIVTPVKRTTLNEVSMNGFEMVNHCINDINTKQLATIEADANKKSLYEEWKPGTPNGTKVSNAFAKIMAKYTQDIQKLAGPEFALMTEALTEKYQDNKTSAEFMKEFLELRIKYVPNLANFDREMQQALEELNVPEGF